MRGTTPIFLVLRRLRVISYRDGEDVVRPSRSRAPWRRIGTRTVGVLSGAGMPALAWAQERPMDPWGMHPMWGMWGAWGSAWGIGMMFMMLVFWGLIIVGVVLAIRWLLTQSRDSRPDSALEILRQRYARGEIDKEEFEAKRRDLG